MAYKVAFCAGHGLNTPGKRTPDGEREWTFNNKVALAFEDEMKQYEGVQLLRTDDRTGQRDVPLKERTDKANAWNADIYISFHHNAFKGVWGNHTGTEVHVYQSKPKDAVRLAKLVHPAVAKAYDLRDRGIKYTNLHITRETKMTAILIEGGFMDSLIDIKRLRDDKVLERAGRAVAQAVAQFAGLKKKTQTVPTHDVYIVKPGDTLWRIAKNHGMTVEEFKKLNGLTSDLIHPGDKLKLRGTTPTESTKNTETYTLVTNVPGYYYAADAKARRHAKTTVIRGTYYVYNRSQGMINVTSKPGVPGSWINPGDNKKDFTVGQKVRVKQSAKKYATGQTIPDWVKGRTYTIMQVKSDRVLLKEIMSWVYQTDVE